MVVVHGVGTERNEGGPESVQISGPCADSCGFGGGEEQCRQSYKADQETIVLLLVMMLQQKVAMLQVDSLPKQK